MDKRGQDGFAIREELVPSYRPQASWRGWATGTGQEAEAALLENSHHCPAVPQQSWAWAARTWMESLRPEANPQLLTPRPTWLHSPVGAGHTLALRTPLSLSLSLLHPSHPGPS